MTEIQRELSNEEIIHGIIERIKLEVEKFRLDSIRFGCDSVKTEYHVMEQILREELTPTINEIADMEQTISILQADVVKAINYITDRNLHEAGADA